MPHALVVEDDGSTRDALTEIVEHEGFSVDAAPDLAEARSKLAATPADLVLTDLILPDGKGLDLFEDLKEAPHTELVVITGNATVSSAIDALRQGAADYLTKPLDVERLRAILTNVSRHRRLREEVSTLRTELRNLGRFGLLIGASPEMQEVYDLIGRVAPTDASVFISGESGTGKELVAKTIHNLSGRRDREFVAVNCGAISPTLIESELFGHEKGSFTGADTARTGHFEFAAGGTIFLDEIGEMSLDLQVKLLRVLETGRILRVGGNENIDVDVRVISATNRPVEDLLGENLLREDLFYRLNVFPISLSPLRARGDDVTLLAEHFLAELNKQQDQKKHLTAAAKKRLLAYDWPGNVRELRNVMQRAYILADEKITAKALPLDAHSGPTVESGTLQFAIGGSIDEAEKRLILATLEHLEGDKKKAAEVLGISLKTLYTRLSVYDAS